MNNIILSQNTAENAGMLEKVLVGGDLSTLTPAERLSYYKATCESMGLNPLSKPFGYINLNGKLTLYALKGATDQLRNINGVSIDSVDFNETNDCYIYTVKGHDKNGRSDVEIGVVSKRDMQGKTENAMMKALTKAKRRLTLSLCGLGWMDETETETVQNAKIVTVTENGEIINNNESLPEPKNETFPGDEEWMKIWKTPEGWTTALTIADANNMEDSTGMPYFAKTNEELWNMERAIRKRLERNHLSDSDRQALTDKIDCIYLIWNSQKKQLGL